MAKEMKLKISLIAFFISCFSANARAQNAKLEGYLFDDRDKLVAGVRIIVPSGQAAVTDNKGHFTISFPVSVQPGQATRIQVDKPNWVIFQPMFGDCVTQSTTRNYEPLLLVIVPKSSLVSLSPRRLSQVIAQWTAERVKLRAEVGSLRQNLDEYAFLRQYAKEYGLTLEQFRDAAQQWAQIKDSDDKEERALKEYWQDNYGPAAQLAEESAQVADQELKQARIKTIELSRKLIRRYKLAGNAYYTEASRVFAHDENSRAMAENRFRKSLDAYNEIEKRFERAELSKENLLAEWAETKFLAGDAKFGLGQVVAEENEEERSRLLKEALAAYQQSATVYTRDRLPQKWAETENNLGGVLLILGEQISEDDEEEVKYLNESVAAFRTALEVRTRELLPLEWATTQQNLGAVLSTLAAVASRASEDEKKVKYLKDAVVAFRAALEVRTQKQLPQQWAGTQNDLGIVLLSLGESVSGADGIKYLKDAVVAFRAALEVRTQEQLPEYWAATLGDLARAYVRLGDWPSAAEAYTKVYTHDPDDYEAYRIADSLYQDKLFSFNKSYALSQQWLAQHPTDIQAQADFAELHFTVGRFAECGQQINALLAKPEVPVRTKTALRAIEVASLLADSKASQVPAKFDALIAEITRQPADFKVTWVFDGTRHFIGQAETLSPYRAWLGQLLDALTSKDRDSMLKALEDVRAKFRKASVFPSEREFPQVRFWVHLLA